MAANSAFRCKVKPKLLKSLSTSRSGKWNFSYVPVRSRAPTQCGYQAGGGQKHRADTTRSPQPRGISSGCRPTRPLHSQSPDLPKPPGPQPFTILLGLGAKTIPRKFIKFWMFIKYPIVHSQTPAQPMQPGTHRDSLPLRYPFPLV